MNTINFFFILTSIAAEDFHTSSFQSIAPPEDSFFCKINKDFQNVTNKLFSSLKLDKNFTELKKVKLLLTMHGNLNSISNNNFKTYKDIEKTNKVGSDNITINALFNLTNVIEEIFEDKDLFLSNNNSSKANKMSTTLWGGKNFSIAGSNEISTDSLLGKINQSNSATTAASRYKRRKSYNLKAWEPSNSSEVSINQTIHTRRIYKGKKTKIKKYAFVVSIHIMGDFTCAGSIISKDLVITSASCLQLAYSDKQQLREHSITIRVGSDYTKKSGEEIPIAEVYFHPQYDPVYLKNNLAIARMEKHLVFKKKKRKIRRIRYDTANRDMSESSVILLGWGDRYNSKLYNGPLTMTRLDVYDLGSCKEVYSENYVSDTNFCAGFASVGSGACNRDVGAPAVVDKYLSGVVSFGPPTCGAPDAPTVFTKLGLYADWIHKIMTMDPTNTATEFINVGENQATTYDPVQGVERNQALLPLVYTLPPVDMQPHINMLRIGNNEATPPNSNMKRIEDNQASPTNVNLLDIFKNQAFISDSNLQLAQEALKSFAHFINIEQTETSDTHSQEMGQNQALVQNAYKQAMEYKQKKLYNMLKIGDNEASAPNALEIGSNQENRYENKPNASKVRMLKKLFRDLVLTGNIDINDIIYPNSDDDKDFFASTKMDIAKHPLVNESLILVPGVHVPDEETTFTTLRTTTLLTLPPVVDQRFLDAINQVMDELEPILAMPFQPHRQDTPAAIGLNDESNEPLRYTRFNVKAGLSDNYEAHESNYFGDDEQEGLLEDIEVKSTTADMTRQMLSSEWKPQIHANEKKRITAIPNEYRHLQQIELGKTWSPEKDKQHGTLTSNAPFKETDVGVRKINKINDFVPQKRKPTHYFTTVGRAGEIFDNT